MTLVPQMMPRPLPVSYDRCRFTSSSCLADKSHLRFVPEPVALLTNCSSAAPHAAVDVAAGECGIICAASVAALSGESGLPWGSGGTQSHREASGASGRCHASRPCRWISVENAGGSWDAKAPYAAPLPNGRASRCQPLLPRANAEAWKGRSRLCRRGSHPSRGGLYLPSLWPAAGAYWFRLASGAKLPTSSQEGRRCFIARGYNV